MPRVHLRELRGIIAATLFCIPTAPLAAQSDMLPALAPRCPTGAAPTVDSSIVTVQIAAADGWRNRKYSAAQRTRIAYYADAIRQHFVPPATLGEIPTLGTEPSAEGRKRPDGRDAGDRAAAAGILVLIVKESGRLGIQAWQLQPLSVPFANAVTAAAMAADSGGAFDGMPPVGKSDGDTLALDIITRLAPVAADPTLMRARIPAYAVSKLPMIERRQAVDYPEEAKRRGVESDGGVHFIVGSDGRAVASSVQITNTTFTDFIAPMREAIVGSIYRAAVSNGCTVPMAVSQPFGFKLDRR